MAMTTTTLAPNGQAQVPITPGRHVDPPQNISQSSPKILGLDLWALDRWLERFHWLHRSSKSEDSFHLGTKLEPVTSTTTDVQDDPTAQQHEVSDKVVAVASVPSNTMVQAANSAQESALPADQSVPGAATVPRTRPKTHQRVVAVVGHTEQADPAGPGVCEQPSLGSNVTTVAAEESSATIFGTERQQIAPKIKPSMSARIQDVLQVKPKVNKGKQPEVDHVEPGVGISAPRDVRVRLSKVDRVKQLKFAPMMKALAEQIQMPPAAIERLANFSAFLGCSVESQINTFGQELPPDLVPSFVQIDEMALGIGSETVTYICIWGWTADDQISNFHRVMAKKQHRHLCEPWKLCYEMFPFSYLAAHGNQHAVQKKGQVLRTAGSTYMVNITSLTSQQSLHELVAGTGSRRVYRTLCSSTLRTTPRALGSIHAERYPESGWFSTIGGLVEVDGIRYALTTAHRPGQNRLDSGAKPSPGSSKPLRRQKSPGVDTNPVDPPLVLVAETTHESVDQELATSPNSGANDVTKSDSVDWVPLATVNETAVTEGRDWRIVPVAAEHHLPNCRDNGDGTVSYIFDCETEPRGGRGLICTPTRTISGQISMNPSFLVSGCAPILKIWTMDIDAQDQGVLWYGHSGTWVFLNSSPCGTLIAASNSKAIITSLPSQLRQVREALGAADVKLPSPALCLLDLAKYHADQDNMSSARSYLDEAYRACSPPPPRPLAFLETVICEKPVWELLWPTLESIILRYGSKLTSVLEDIARRPSSLTTFVLSGTEMLQTYLDLVELLKEFKASARNADTTVSTNTDATVSSNIEVDIKNSLPQKPSPLLDTSIKPKGQDLRTLPHDTGGPVARTRRRNTIPLRLHMRVSQTRVFRRTDYAQMIFVFLWMGFMAGIIAGIVWRTLIHDASDHPDGMPSLSKSITRGMVLGLISSSISSLGLFAVYALGSVEGNLKLSALGAVSCIVLAGFLSLVRSALCYSYLRSQSPSFSAASGSFTAAAPFIISTFTPFLILVVSLSIYMRASSSAKCTVLEQCIATLQKYTIRAGVYIGTVQRRLLKGFFKDGTLAVPGYRAGWAGIWGKEAVQFTFFALIWILQIGFDSLAGYTFMTVARASGDIPPNMDRYFALIPGISALAVFSALSGLWFPLIHFLLRSHLSASYLLERFLSQRWSGQSNHDNQRFSHGIDLILVPERRIGFARDVDIEIQNSSVQPDHESVRSREPSLAPEERRASPRNSVTPSDDWGIV